MIDEFIGLELARSSIDDLLHDRELVLIDGLVADCCEKFVGGADLVRKSQCIYEQTLAVWTDRDDPLARVDYDLPDRGLSGVAQRLANDAIALFGDTAVREQIIGSVDLYRIEGGGIDKFSDLDRIVRLEAQFLQIGRLDRHVTALLVLVALDDFGALDGAEPRHHGLVAHALA
jgi:hypothetical protein